MDAPILLIFLFMLSAARAASHEAVPAEVHWRTFLPKTPIPATIQELIQSGKEMGSFESEKSPAVFVKYKSTGSENQISSEMDSFEHEKSPAVFVKYKLAATKNQKSNEMNSFEHEKSPAVFVKYKSSEMDSFEHEKSPAVFVKYKSDAIKNKKSSEMDSFEHEKSPAVFVKYKSVAIKNKKSSEMDSFEYEKSLAVFVKYKSAATKKQISSEMDFFEQEKSPAVFVKYKSAATKNHISSEMNSLESEKNPTVFVKYKSNANAMDSSEQEESPAVSVKYKSTTSQAGEKDSIAPEKSSATENPVSKNPNAALLFLEESLRQGTKMTLDLTKMRSVRPFLSACKARETPFSLAKLPEILALFSIKRGSLEAAAVQRTLAECEELQLLDDERRRCATSVESMVEFVEAELGGRDIRVLETALRGDGVVPPKQEYMVGPAGARLVRAEAMVSCHPEPYPRAVYYCHRTTSIEAYKVELMGANGAAVDVLATCHTDTSAWSPEYLGFSLLKVKPGTHICHFMPQGHLIFARLSKNKATAEK